MQVFYVYERLDVLPSNVSAQVTDAAQLVGELICAWQHERTLDEEALATLEEAGFGDEGEEDEEESAFEDSTSTSLQLVVRDDGQLDRADALVLQALKRQKLQVASQLIL